MDTNKQVPKKRPAREPPATSGFRLLFLDTVRTIGIYD